MSSQSLSGRKYCEGLTLIEVMVASAVLAIAIYFLVDAIYHVSVAQQEMYNRLAATAAIEQIAEQVMAYTGDNIVFYYEFFH